MKNGSRARSAPKEVKDIHPPVRLYSVRQSRRKQATLKRYIDAGIGVRADISVADKLGVTRQRIEQVRKILSLPVPLDASRRERLERYRLKTNAIAKRIAKLAEQGHSTGKIAKLLGDGEGSGDWLLINRIAEAHGIVISRSMSFIYHTHPNQILAWGIQLLYILYRTRNHRPVARSA